MKSTISFPLVCDPKDCSMPGFPVHRQLPEPAQTHVHRVGDANQPLDPAFNLSLYFWEFYLLKK